MDSMRHLSTSLPYSSRPRNETDLLSSFKAAALSVTQLYKAAAAGNSQAREAGYQDALEDLLAYMDKEKIGLNDGEGWNVRRWLLQRIEDTPAGKASSSDDGEESQREDGDVRLSSPERRKSTTELEETVPEVAEEQQSIAPKPQTLPPSSNTSVPSSKDFTFRSTTQYPTNHDREGQHGAMEVDQATQAIPTTRTSKTSSKSRSNHHVRREGRPQHTSLLMNLGPAAGGKRKLPYSDFFDISGVTLDNPDWRDNGSRGGKRARQT